MCYNAFNRGIFGQQGTEKLHNLYLSQAFKITTGTILKFCPSNPRVQLGLDLNMLTPLFEYGERIMDS